MKNVESNYELILLLLAYIPPFLLSFYLLIKSYIKYPSGILIRLISITLLIAIWIHFSIPWILNLDSISEDNIILLAHFGSISGTIARIMLAAIFIKPDLGKTTFRIALTSASLSSMLLGIRFMQILGHDDGIYSITLTDGGWEEIYHPAIQVIIIFSTLLLFIAFVLAFRLLNSLPEAIIDKQLKKLNNIILFTFSLGGFFSLLTIFITRPYFPELFLLSFIGSRFMIASAFVMLARYVSLDPLFIFQEKGNLNKFINEGILGWTVSINGDMGPENLIISSAFSEKYGIKKDKFVSFSASVITVIGITKSFQETVFMIPFSGSHTLTALNVTFHKKDSRLKDRRFKGVALGVFSILIPVSLMSKLRSLDNAVNILQTELSIYDELEDIVNEEILNSISIKIINEILI